jgi:hypothetical protein
MLTLIFVIILLIILFVIYKFFKFLSTGGLYIPSSLVVSFLNEVKKIESVGNGEVIVKTMGDFKIIVLMKDSNILDSISVDMKDNKVYSGIVSDNSPNWSDILIPVRLPYNTSEKTVDEIRTIEDSMVDEIIKIIVTYESNME